MKTYLSEIIPKINQFSKRLDYLTLITSQHWIVLNELNKSKTVYIFRNNNELLISNNGKIEKAKWEYLGKNSLLIDRKNESLLFKHGFLDENILALKLDGKNEYAFLVNENCFEKELNSIEKINQFLNEKYIKIKTVKQKEQIENDIEKDEFDFFHRKLKTNKGILIIKTQQMSDFTNGDEVFFNGKLAEDGKYIYGWPSWLMKVKVKNGKIL